VADRVAAEKRLLFRNGPREISVANHWRKGRITEKFIV
jgi:hypothetical protein